MPKVVTYCRVSSDEQAEKDLSIPAQRKALRRWVDEQPEFELVAEFADEGQSAYAPAEKRPGFCEMVSFCRKSGIDFILVHKLDRFSRNREESILFKGLLRRSGVAVKSITEHFDPETPQGFLYEGMIEVINQFYSMNLATEVLKGLKENASRGWFNGGIAPYGYRRVRVTDDQGREHVTLELGAEEEVKVVREIFELATENGMGGKGIAAELNARGVPAPSAKHWNASTINIMLRNRVYCGDLVWMKTKKKGRSGRVATDEDEQIVVPDAHPAIIDRELFDSRETASRKRRFAAHDSPHRHVKYLLGRLIHCENCGNTFVGRRRAYKNHRGERVETYDYYCSGYLFKGASVCRSLPIDQAWIEGVVLDAIRARLCEPEGWQELADALERQIDERRRRFGEDPKAAQAKLVEIDRKIESYYRAIGEGLDPAVCKRLIAELQEKREAVEREAAVLSREDYYTEALRKNLEALTRFRELFREGFDELPFGVRRQAVLYFVEGLRVRERREVTIHLKVALDTLGIEHLNEAMRSAQNEAQTQKSEEAPADGAGASYEQGPYDQSGPKWWLGADSNRRHHGYEPCALTS